MHSAVALLAVAIAGQIPAPAPAPTLLPPGPSGPGVRLTRPPADPLANVFPLETTAEPGQPDSRTAADLSSLADARVRGAREVRIICGMKVFTADPRIDPEMIVRARPGSPDRMPRITATTCTEPDGVVPRR